MESQQGPGTGYPQQPPPGYPQQQPPPGYCMQAPPPGYPQYPPNPYYGAPAPQTVPRGWGILVFIPIVLLAILLIVLISLRLAFQPWPPKFTVESAQANNFNVSSAASLVSGIWDFGFSVRNSNKMKINYEHIDATLYYKSATLAQNGMLPFKQDDKSTAPTRASFYIGTNKYDGKTVSDMSFDKSRGVVSFDVKLLARFTVGNPWLTGRSRMVKISCDDIKIGFGNDSGSGSLTGGSKECKSSL